MLTHAGVAYERRCGRIGLRSRLALLTCVAAGICSGAMTVGADLSRGDAPSATSPDATAECVVGTPGAAPVVFRAIGAEQCYRVPPDVASVHVVAIGARPLSDGSPDPRSG
ncbi:MAG: hypothetical protein LC749_07200, partial [Actinobacteria bacterium]|nr:hypothetical protein [Actinomycetota bacterium]